MKMLTARKTNTTIVKTEVAQSSRRSDAQPSCKWITIHGRDVNCWGMTVSPFTPSRQATEGEMKCPFCRFLVRSRFDGGYSDRRFGVVLRAKFEHLVPKYWVNNAQFSKFRLPESLQFYIAKKFISKKFS